MCIVIVGSIMFYMDVLSDIWLSYGEVDLKINPQKIPLCHSDTDLFPKSDTYFYFSEINTVLKG